MSDAEVSETSAVTRVFGHEIKADSFFFTEQSIKRKKKKKKEEGDESAVRIMLQVVRAAGRGAAGFRAFCDVA